MLVFITSSRARPARSPASEGALTHSGARHSMLVAKSAAVRAGRLPMRGHTFWCFT